VSCCVCCQDVRGKRLIRLLLWLCCVALKYEQARQVYTSNKSGLVTM